MRRKPPLKLQRPPLVFALAQIRFSPVLKMGDYVPDLQESMRRIKLTRYVEERTQQIIFGPEVKTDQGLRWLFSSRDRKESVVLTRDFVVYETNRYGSFEGFLDRVKEIVSALGSIVRGLDFAEQIGLRYVDLIRPHGSTEAREFFRETLRGVSAAELEVGHVRHQWVTQAKTLHGDLYLRSFDNSEGKFMPPDLDSSRLEFDFVIPNDEQFRVLDFDHIYRGEVEFDFEPIAEKLWALHDVILKAFLVAVTPAAIAHWQEVDE